MFQFSKKRKEVLLKEELHSLEKISELKSEISFIEVHPNLNGLVDINSKMHSSSVLKLSREKRRLKRTQKQLKAL